MSEEVYYTGRLGRVGDQTFELPGVRGPSAALRKAMPGEPRDDWALYGVLAGLLLPPLLGALLSQFHLVPAGVTVLLMIVFTVIGFKVPVDMGNGRGRARGCLTVCLNNPGKAARRQSVAKQVPSSAAPRPLTEILAGAKSAKVTIVGLSASEIDEVCAALMKAVPSSD